MRTMVLLFLLISTWAGAQDLGPLSATNTLDATGVAEFRRVFRVGLKTLGPDGLADEVLKIAVRSGSLPTAGTETLAVSASAYNAVLNPRRKSLVGRIIYEAFRSAWRGKRPLSRVRAHDFAIVRERAKTLSSGQRARLGLAVDFYESAEE